MSNLLFFSKINLVDCINVSVFQYIRTKSRFDFAMNNTLKHVSKLIFLLSLSSIMEHAPTKNERREENVCAITQNFEVMEHEQTAKS